MTTPKPTNNAQLSFPFRGRPVPVTFHPSVALDLAEKALNSEPFQTWVSRCEKNHNNKRLELHSVEIQSVDLFGQKVGFCKLKSHCTLVDGDAHHEEHSLPGICFLRGNAVSILVALCCNGETYSLLVEQPRVPIGQASVLELPAGMIDATSDGIMGTAAKEMEEECGISVKPSEMVDLTELAGVGVGNVRSAGISPSPGACDELCRLLYLEKEVTVSQLEDMKGHLLGLREEGEIITLQVVRMDEVWKLSGDYRSMCSLFLLDKLRQGGKLPPLGDLSTPLSPPIPSLQTHDGSAIPQLAFGLYKVPASVEGEEIILNAVKAGYRHFDTAAFYGNEATLGRALRKSGLSREDFFITSKVWNDSQRTGRATVRASVEEGLAALDFGDYFDLYLVHWPIPNHFVETYKELEVLHGEGKIRSLGLSNFSPAEYETLIEEGIAVMPSINQIEVSAVMYRPERIKYFQNRGILVGAFKPLNRAACFDKEPIPRIAEAYGKTPAQVLLRWALQKGLIVVSKTATPSRMKENINVLDFVLNKEDMLALDSLTIAEDIKERERREAKSKLAL
jgi:diketogulonate reductase-like aldo/keto reductase/8-oxo-dGTP pyrophosphatase MutT (NUDIX family)